MANLVGKTLGKYTITERLGKGGMAEVYKAYHPVLDRYVTIKVLHSFLAEGEDFLARFKREARAVASLRHPHIVQIHDFDVEDDQYYMVMEFIDWGTLQRGMMDLASSGAYMPANQVLSILGEVAEALDYAHKRGIIHRDIKPSNILLDSAGHAFLADFGISRMMSGTQFTATGTLIGTPTYMSPEQGMGAELTTASDIYSLGVILYELLTGKVPFASETTPLAIIHKHIHEPPPNPRALRPNLPAAAEQVLLKALAKEPKERYQSARELAHALTEALSPEAIAKLEASTGEVEIPVAERPTELVETPAADQASIPTVAFGEETKAGIASPPLKRAEPGAETDQSEETKRHAPPGEVTRKAAKHTAAAIPIYIESTRMSWVILLVGIGFMGSRFLFEYLARLTNFFGLGLGMAATEIILGAFGLCVGALLWLAIRSSGIHPDRRQTIALLITWCGSYLSIGLLAYLIDVMSEMVWAISFAFAGLLGGLLTGLILAKTTLQFGVKKVLLLAVSSAIFVVLSSYVSSLNTQLLPDSQSSIDTAIRFGIGSGLTGLLTAWTLLRLVLHKEEPDSPTMRSANMEWNIIILTFGWVLVRFLCQFIFLQLFQAAGIDINHPAWPLRTILTLSLTGLLSGVVLWLVLLRMRTRLGKNAFLLLPLVWAGGFLLGSLVPTLLFNNKWVWAICVGLGAAISGILTARMVSIDGLQLRLRQMILVGAGFGLGSALGTLAFFTASVGLKALNQDIALSLSSSLASAGSALAGGSILIGLLSKRDTRTEWRLVLAGFIGIAIGSLLADLPYYALGLTTEIYKSAMYVIYGLGFGIALTIFTKNVRTYLLYGILASLGFLCGRYLYRGIREMISGTGNVTLFYVLIGLMLGLFLTLGRRVQWTILLALTAILAFLTAIVVSFPSEQSILYYLQDVLQLGILGAALGLTIGYFRMLPEKDSMKESG